MSTADRSLVLLEKIAAGVADLKTDVRELKIGQTRLAVNYTKLEAGQTRLEAKLDASNGKLDDVLVMLDDRFAENKRDHVAIRAKQDEHTDLLDTIAAATGENIGDIQSLKFTKVHR